MILFMSNTSLRKYFYYDLYIFNIITDFDKPNIIHVVWYLINIFISLIIIISYTITSQIKL